MFSLAVGSSPAHLTQGISWEPPRQEVTPRFSDRVAVVFLFFMYLYGFGRQRISQLLMSVALQYPVKGNLLLSPL